MIASIIQAGVGIADQISDIHAERAEANAATNADGTMNYNDYAKGMRHAELNAALTNPTKLFSLRSRKRAMKKQIAQQRNAYNNNTINTMINNQDNSLKDGGEVKKGKGKTPSRKGGQLEGAGGPKDDAIPASLNKGDVVIPADADPDIVSYIMERLGLDKPVDQQDVNDGQGTSVNLSNGETIIPAAYVGEAEKIAQELGTSLAELMPNAQSEIDEDGQYATGLLDVDKLKTIASSTASSPIGGAVKPMVGKDAKSVSVTPTSGALKGKPSGMGVHTDVKRPTGKIAMAKMKKAVSDNPEAIAATGQIVAGSMMAMNSGKRPNVDVSNDMSAIATRASNRRNAAISKLKVGQEENAQEKYRINVDNAVRVSPGGSSAIASAQQAASELASDKNAITREIASAELDGIGDDTDLELKVADAKRDAQKNKQEHYDNRMEGASNLVSAGINNIIGSSEYRKNRKALEALIKLREKDPLKD